MTDFPTLTRKVDVKNFEYEQEDPAMRQEMEGGYVTSRPRHTRTPRRTFTIGLANMPDTDRVLLDAFWNTVKGGSLAWNWIHPITAEVIVVRFLKKPPCKHVGPGDSKRWDCLGIVLEEV